MTTQLTWHFRSTVTGSSISAGLSYFTIDNDVWLSKKELNWYPSFIRAISYLAVFTRPDISLSGSLLESELHSPAKRHFVLAKIAMRYIAITAKRKMFSLRSIHNSEPLLLYTDFIKQVDHLPYFFIKISRTLRLLEKIMAMIGVYQLSREEISCLVSMR